MQQGELIMIIKHFVEKCLSSDYLLTGLSVGEFCYGTRYPGKQHPAFLSNDAHSRHDESVSQVNNKLSNPTIRKRGCHGFAFYSRWQGGAVGHPLSSCSCCFWTIACLKTVNYNPSFTVHGSHGGYLFVFSLGQTKEERRVCKVSHCRALRSSFHILAKQMKNERDKYNRVSIHHAVSFPSLYLVL